MSLEAADQNYKLAIAFLNSDACYGFRRMSWRTAEKYLKEALRVYMALPQSNYPGNFNVLTILAELYFRMGRDEESVKMLEQALGIAHARNDYVTAKISDLYFNHGYLLKSLGKTNKAIESLEKSVGILIALRGEDHSSLVDSTHLLGVMYLEQELYGKALAMSKMAVDISRKVHKDRQCADVADCLIRLEHAQKGMGFREDAQGCSQEAFALSRRIHGKSHPMVLEAMSHVARAQQGLKLYDDAIATASEILKIQRSDYEKDHDDVTDSIVLLAMVYSDKGTTAKALCLFEEARAVYDRRGISNCAAATCLFNIAKIREKSGDRNMAIAVATKAAGIWSHCNCSCQEDAAGLLRTLQSKRQRRS